jgi:hypothetical protein
MCRYLSVLLVTFYTICAVPCYGGDQLTKILEGIRKNYGTPSGLTLRYEREIITKSMAMMGMRSSPIPHPDNSTTCLPTS